MTGRSGRTTRWNVFDRCPNRPIGGDVACTERAARGATTVRVALVYGERCARHSGRVTHWGATQQRHAPEPRVNAKRFADARSAHPTPARATEEVFSRKRPEQQLWPDECGAGNRIRTCNRQFTKLLRYRCVMPAISSACVLYDKRAVSQNVTPKQRLRSPTARSITPNRHANTPKAAAHRRHMYD